MIPDAAGNDTCLPAFAQMYHSICSSNIHLVSVADLPNKLMATKKDKGKRPDPGLTEGADRSRKKESKKKSRGMGS